MSEIKVDTVAEKTSANGVTVDGLNIKDSKLVTANSVVETNLTDNIVTLAKMASGTDGNIISYDASGNPVAIATGSDGQVLTSTGAGSPPAFEALPSGGKILQVVSTAYPNAGQTTITSTSYTVIPGYNVEITPSSTSSKIYVTGSAHFDSGGNGNEIGLAIYRYKDGSYTNPISYASDYGQTSDSSRENKTVPAWSYIDSPNTTGTLYYAFYAKTSSSDTIYLNRKTCNITVMEIGA